MVCLELRLEAWDSSSGTTGTSGSLSCCLRKVKSPFELRGRARECSGVMARESGLNWHGSGNLKVFLELQQEVWVPSSCHGDLREPLVLSLGSQESFRVVRGLSGFPSSWWGLLRPHLQLRRETQVLLFLLWLHPFILSGVISPLISSSILGTYRPGEFIFQ